MKKAVIMAGGFGTRLRPLTNNLPKPMVPVCNIPMMEHIVHLLKKHSITDIISLLYFQPEKITSHFGNGSQFGVSMKYVEAAADYGTAGSVRNAHEHLGERFLIISGDVLTDFDISAALAYHEEKGAKATIVLTQAENPLQFGIVMTNDEGHITRFLEKPSWGEVFSDTINTGIYILEPEILDMIPYQKDFDFSKDLFPLMLKNGMPLFGYVASGYWQDIGNLEQYREAHNDVLKGKVQLEMQGERRDDSVIASTAVVHETARLKGVVIVGENTTIGPHAEVVNTVLGNDVTIAAGARVVNSILWNRVSVGEGAELYDDVVCNDTAIGRGATIAENVFIADHCVIGEGAELLSNIKLWPERSVESHAILSRSLVQEEKWLRELFSNARVTGISNIEMNPEFGAKFGAALGNAFGPNATLIASRDANLVSRMVKRAITAGLMSVGVHVNDLQLTPLPITRQALANGTEVAGFHVRQSPRNPKHIDIIVLNADGRDLPASRTKAIERLFFGEDIRRVRPDEVGRLHFPERTNEAYLSQYVNSLNVEAIAGRKFNIVVDYSYGMTSNVFPRILGELDCNAVTINGYVDSRKSSRDDDETSHAQEQLSKLITSLKYAPGFIIDPSSEKIWIVDEEGRWYSQIRLLSIMTKLVLETHRHREPYKIVVPISAPQEIELMAAEYNVDVLRIKNSHSAMMDTTQEPGVLFVGGTRGGFIFTDFFFASDGMFSIGKTLEMLATSGKTIAQINESIPERKLYNREVSCPWESKGTIMRKAMEYSEQMERQLIDGVKIFDNGRSVLLLPDRERAVFHVLAEADTDENAHRFAENYISLVEHWRDDH